MSAEQSGFKLFPFQEEGAQALREAALRWVAHAMAAGAPRYGTAPIPFVGQLKAVTGAGKTPILAEVVGGLGDAVVLWTSKASAVVEQTYNNLRGRYRGLLPDGTKIIREIPAQHDWYELVNGKSGLTVWVLTTASWNESEAARSGGTADARLNLHRPQADWAGEVSPWEQLKKLGRRLWIVSDESHNQTDTQLDLLHALRPVGFFMASATPVHGGLFDEWQRILDREPEWRELLAAGQIPIRTRDVVAAELLKTTIELVDYQSGTEESLDGALGALRRLDEAVTNESASVTPRAVYVVEKSNPRPGDTQEARPVVIWRHLRSRGVDARSIAIFTDTRQLPPGAEKISSLSKLEPRHRHIIFNQSLQEGWDDPEAYVCYFDGTTRSFLRIRQIVGRILRQPNARRFVSDQLNTATLIINTPADAYDQVLSELRTELRLYAPDEEAGDVPIRVKTRREPLTPIPIKEEYEGALQLQRVSLEAPNMSSQLRVLRTEGQRVWPQVALDAPGLGRLSVLSLASESVERAELLEVLRSARTLNSIYFRRRLAARNRNALNAVDPDSYMKGPAFQQHSCQGSQAQVALSNLAGSVADYYEDRVTYEADSDPDLATWVAGEHRPRNGDLAKFEHAAHPAYSRGSFNRDEFAFAQALDAYGKGVWLRNADSGSAGYSIPLPFKVGDSLRFFPDFVWWPHGPSGVVWALDTTGRHLVAEKIRGKLVDLGRPRTALVVRGEVNLAREYVVGHDGWSLVLAREGMKPLKEHADDVQKLLDTLYDLG